MLTLTATQAAFVALASKKAKWAFYIYDKNGVGYSFCGDAIGGVAWITGTVWETGTVWDDGYNLTSIVLTDFSGIELRRSMADGSIIAPSEVTFNISNPANALAFTDFKGGSVFIELWLSNLTQDVKIAGWRFRIKTAEPGYQKLKITAEDFLQQYLRGDYPNTRLPADIFPSNRSYERADICLPVPFGTAYVPLRDVYIDGAVTRTASTIGAVASAAGARCQFTDSASGFGIFEQGRTITVSGFTGNAANNGTFIILSVAPGVIEVAYDAGLVTEAAAEAITITHGSGYIMLGDMVITSSMIGATANTFSITKIRSPRAWGQKSEYSSGSYTFTQSTKADSLGTNWRVFQAIIADINNDGVADAPGYWMTTNGPVLDPPVQFTRSDTATMTNPADVIKFVLVDMGVPGIYIDDVVSFPAAHAVYVGQILAFNGAFWFKQDRQKILSQLLTMCHSTLRITEKVELHPLVIANQKTITAAEILRTDDQGEGSFTYRDLANEDLSDSAYVAWQQSGEAQDDFLRMLVSIFSTSFGKVAWITGTVWETGTVWDDGYNLTDFSGVISKDTFECPFVQDSQDVQRIGKLHFQRCFMKEAEVGFLAKGTCLALQPDDMITISATNYGGTYLVLIDSMRINKDISIQFQCTRFTT